MQRSESITKLMKALAAARKDFAAVTKDHTNPAFRAKYASLNGVLEAVEPALERHGLELIQPPGSEGDAGMYVETVLFHLESGEWLSCRYPLVAAKPDPQGYGSATTYARRYSIMSLLRLVAEDDDGEQAHGRGHGHDYGRQQEPYRQQDRRPDRQPPPRGQQDRRPQQGGGPDRAPTDGRQLFAWVKKREENGADGLLKHLNEWASALNFPSKMVVWDADQTAEGYSEALRTLDSEPAY